MSEGRKTRSGRRGRRGPRLRHDAGSCNEVFPWRARGGQRSANQRRPLPSRRRLRRHQGLVPQQRQQRNHLHTDDDVQRHVLAGRPRCSHGLPIRSGASRRRGSCGRHRAAAYPRQPRAVPRPERRRVHQRLRQRAQRHRDRTLGNRRRCARRRRHRHHEHHARLGDRTNARDRNSQSNRREPRQYHPSVS